MWLWIGWGLAAFLAIWLAVSNELIVFQAPKAFQSDSSQCIEWENGRCRVSVDDLRRRLD